MPASGVEHPLDAALEAEEQRLARELVLRREVRVEAADGQAGAPHDRVDRRRLDAAVLHEPVGRRQDPSRVCLLCSPEYRAMMIIILYL